MPAASARTPGPSSTANAGFARIPPESDAAAILAALDRPGSVAVEDGLDLPDILAEADPYRRDGGLFLAVRARTAVAADIAYVLIQVLDRHVAPAEDLRDAVVTALQEALANAVLHGCLEMSAFSRESTEAYLAFGAAMEERLADPSLGGRPVGVGMRWTPEIVEVAVTDRGKGYLPEDLAARPWRDASGRGLTLIAELADEVAFAARGSRIVMRFRR
jgi:anti-sigma regulatory factor (Ser/Thr protein kinase)